MQFEKRAVRLGDIRPSEQNPREDFGDIGALARSIEATGGEPLNPPVVVADGNVFRIVDGERRYRALSSIYGEDREVSALVADTMDEANELVAMLATDDKRQLTEAERARGVQQMLVLGIDEEDVEAVLAAGEGWAGKADSIRRRVEREEAKAEDYDAFGDAGIPVVKEQPEGFVYKDWANCGLAAEKLEKKEFAAGTVAVWKGSYWDLYEPDDGSGAEPEKTEEEIRAEQEAAREEAALKDLYRSLIGFVASGAFAMSKDLMMHVRVSREDPSALLVAMGGDSHVENEARFGAVREEFARNLKACKPSEYEAGCWLMAAAKDMAQLNNRWGGDDAEAWLDHYGIFCSVGFEPGEEDVWLMERVQASFKEEKDE